MKRAGGAVDGFLRCSASWFNRDDLDIYLHLPNGRAVSFHNPKEHYSQAELDVDANRPGSKLICDPVENITIPLQEKMLEGKYRFVVNNYQKRDSADVGFDAEIECNGELFSYSHAKGLKTGDSVTVATFSYSHKDGLKIIESLPSNDRSIDAWGLSTGEFHPVDMIMKSPNHWDGQEIGNEHCFFVLKNCKNPDSVRGFFNEFLRNELRPHRKVFGPLGQMMQAPATDDQLSGVGFSSTLRNHATLRISGKFNRVIKVLF